MFNNLIPWRHKQEARPSRGELTTKSPANTMARYGDGLGSLVDRMWNQPLSLWDDFDSWNVGWNCDVEDSEKEIVVRAEAPGFEPNEIDVQMSGNRLVLQAEHKEENKQGSGHTMHYGKFYRTMALPHGIESDQIKAEYKNGVLEVHLPKGPEAQAKRIPVKAS